MGFWAQLLPRAAAAQPAAPTREQDELVFDAAFQRRLETLALVARRVLPGTERAERRSRHAGQGIELADYRAYAPGDDIRRIDWNAYGRTERLMLRLYEQEEDLAVYVLLDCSASMGATRDAGPSKLVYGKRLAAALAYVALGHLDRVSVSALGTGVSARMPAARGRGRIFAVLDFLRPLPASGPTSLGAAVSAFVAQQRRPGLAVLISDLYDPVGFERALDALRYARFETHVIHLRDAAEQQPVLRGDVELIDAETGERRQVTVTPALLARYQKAYAAYVARIESACRERQVPLHAVPLDRGLEDAVLRILRRGGLVG